MHVQVKRGPATSLQLLHTRLLTLLFDNVTQDYFNKEKGKYFTVLVTCSFTACTFRSCTLVDFLAQGKGKGQGTEIPKSSSAFAPGYSLLSKHQIHKVTQSKAIPSSKASCRGSQAFHARKRAHIFI